MPKKNDTPSTNETAIPNEETSFASTSQLTTVLGGFNGATSTKKVTIGASYLILTIVLVLALLGIGAYLYVQQNQISETQSQFNAFDAQLDKVNAAASQVLQGDNERWERLNKEFASLQNTWNSLGSSYNVDKPQTEYKLFSTYITALKGSQSSLNSAVTSMKAIEEEGGTATSLQATQWVATINKVKNEVGLVSSKVVDLKAKLQEAQNDVVQNIKNLQQMAAYAALALGILIALLIIATMRKIGTYETSVTQERNQLKALVDDWQNESEEQRQSAQERYASAQRVNEANQAAILRLMNELQNLAEGDLTQQATVTEDITGAIADSVNYTMEELRNLVSQVQNATELVSRTTATVESTSTELLASSDEQLREIHETGQSVLDVAERINNVSTQAQQSATVARQSMDAAEKGMLAVQNAIGGMNTIRDQIQDTSKRIKRLVESSQEIGEITDLIADITEQTNILALNAAIQAASAGEAGRGFSIVAEEVQRLAERSADATRQIATLIRTIQGDMHDAMEAMEHSTRDVVEGARQTDETGTAFTEIDSVTRRLASLIQQISEETLNEAKVANGVAENIQHIFAVTEQTAKGTRSTALQVRELARVAEQLERSVARFRIS